MTVYNSLAQSDSYKLHHQTAYHPEIAYVYSNFTSRSGRLSNVKGGTDVVFVGLQYFIKDVLLEEWNNTFFNVPKDVAIKSLKRLVFSMSGTVYDATHFENLHDLGYLPLEIKSLPEGTSVPYGVPPITFKNTVAGYRWLVNYIETVFSTENWPIQTSATTAKAYFNNITQAFVRTGMSMETIPFMCHDFSFRGCFGRHAAAMSGFGHLCSGFAGTDTMPAVLFAERYYNADLDNELVGASVFADEHSTVTSYIMYLMDKRGITKADAEIEYVRSLFDKVPTGIVSHVSDSFDFWGFVENGLEALREDIMSREGTFVVRPDSGGPVEVLCGEEIEEIEAEDYETFLLYAQDYMDDTLTENTSHGEYGGDLEKTYKFKDKYYKCYLSGGWNRYDKQYYYLEDSEITSVEEVFLSPEQKGLVECLWDMFGGTVTDKGYKVLESHIGAIYGDSITLERQKEIIRRLEDKGFVPSVVLGVGSYSYQYVTRDTHGSAVKNTYVADENHNGIEVFKDPKTDSGKKSAKGLLRVELENGKYVLYDQQTPEQELQGELKTVFLDGVLTRETTLEEIRGRVKASL